MANVKDLLVNGSARVIGTIYGNATSANKLNTNAGSASQPVYFSNGVPVAITSTISNNAATATKLATARTINGTSFDGSANITTANWGTARTLTIGNTGKSVNGSGNISWSLSEIGAAASSHNHTSLTGVTSIAFSAESSDSASIKTTVDGSNTYFDFMMSDDLSQNDQWRWRFTPSGGTIYDAMKLNPTAQGKADLYVGGTKVSLEGHIHNYAGSSSAGGAANSANKLTTARIISLTGSVTGSGSFDGSGNLSIATTTNHNHDDRYYTESEMNTKLNAKLNTSLKGAASGLAELDASGKVPSSQLPSYVDDIIEGYLYNSKFYKESAHTTEITAETGKIYVDLSNNKTYRWSGSTYVIVSETLALGETSSTAYRGDRGKIAYDHSQSTHARTDATAVSFSRSLTSGTKVGTITINGTGTDLYAPTNTDTHWTTHLKVGASNTATANAVASNGSVYLNVLDNSTVRDSHKITGSGATSVTSDANGVITISSTNTTYGVATTSANGLMSASDKSKLDGIAAGANKYSHPTSSGNKHIPAGGSSGQILRWSADGTAVWGADNNTWRGIQNNLTSDSTTDSLAAAQGKALKALIDGKAASSHTHNYLPLSGGTLTGTLALDGGADLNLKPRSSSNDSGDIVFFYSNGQEKMRIWSDNEYLGYHGPNFRLYKEDGTYLGGSHLWAAGESVTGAVWNDYAEYREADTIQGGRCVREVGDDTLALTTKRLMRGCSITSDTWGFAQGETDKAKTPIAVAGRVLAYPLEDRELFKEYIGYSVCSGPNGTVSLMTEEEELKYPWAIVGTVSAVPDYEEWGGGEMADRPSVKVDGRIWIKVK